mmetsp:Transcript_103497/g.297313  ORF Transcript_103497/g.297313 Transcript_103497/m.297313 type:complete len:191 (+) Transcript_103497:3-575(+)
MSRDWAQVALCAYCLVCWWSGHSVFCGSSGVQRLPGLRVSPGRPGLPRQAVTDRATALKLLGFGDVLEMFAGTVEENDIRNSFRKQAMLLSPDRPGGDAEKFRELQSAYEFLSGSTDLMEEMEFLDEAIRKQRVEEFLKNAPTGAYTRPSSTDSEEEPPVPWWTGFVLVAIAGAVGVWWSSLDNVTKQQG